MKATNRTKANETKQQWTSILNGAFTIEMAAHQQNICSSFKIKKRNRVDNNNKEQRERETEQKKNKFQKLSRVFSLPAAPK